MCVLKTLYVSIKTEFFKHFFVFFSKPEKLSYEVLNGHRRYINKKDINGQKKRQQEEHRCFTRKKQQMKNE